MHLIIFFEFKESRKGVRWIGSTFSYVLKSLT